MELIGRYPAGWVGENTEAIGMTSCRYTSARQIFPSGFHTLFSTWLTGFVAPDINPSHLTFFSMECCYCNLKDKGGLSYLVVAEWHIPVVDSEPMRGKPSFRDIS
jgi:hypothetical protein